MKIPANDLARNITLNVTITGYHGWLIRLKVAMLLIRFACYISGMGLRFVPTEDIRKHIEYKE